MPGRDASGPLGLGPQTGGGWGNCSNPSRVRYFGRGFSNYCRRGFSRLSPIDQENRSLQSKIEQLEQEVAKLSKALNQKPQE